MNLMWLLHFPFMQYRDISHQTWPELPSDLLLPFLPVYQLKAVTKLILLHQERFGKSHKTRISFQRTNGLNVVFD